MIEVIATTLGMDYDELKEYRYQPGHTNRAIYAVGDYYYTTGKRKPKDDYAWQEHRDQFWAKQKNTILWIGK